MSRCNKISVDPATRQSVLIKFLSGDITFKEVGTALGLNDNDIDNYLGAKWQGRYING